MKLKYALTNYLLDLYHWQGIDLSSVNHYTDGTPEFASKEELRAYLQEVEKLVKELPDD